MLRLGLLTLLLPLIGIAATIFFLPLGFGNAYAARLAGTMEGHASGQERSYVVQLTLCPRIRHGWRAWLEDADDLGCLSFAPSALLYQGDAVKLTVPFSQIERVQTRNVGWRGLFVYGRRIVVSVRGLPQATAFEFADRSSWLLPTSWRITRQLSARLASVSG